MQPRLDKPRQKSRRRIVDPFQAWKLAKKYAAEWDATSIDNSDVVMRVTPESTLSLENPIPSPRVAPPRGLDIAVQRAMPPPRRDLRTPRKPGRYERDKVPLESHALKVIAREQGAGRAFKHLQRQVSWALLDEDVKTAQSVFEWFDRDEDGKLSAQEVRCFLHEQDIEIENLVDLQSAIELASGKGQHGIDLDGFLGLVAYSKARRRGYSMDDLKTLRQVFDAYDANHSGALETSEWSALLSDSGFAPRTRQESQALGDVVSECCGSGLPGPLKFAEFLLLAERIDKEELGVCCYIDCKE
jgi:Ca2+-binding EF-hand superfamily protein